MRCVITGATGLIGTVVMNMISDDWEVFRILRRPSAETYRKDRDIVWDLASSETPGSLPQQIDAFVYLAQSEHFRNFPDRAADILSVNTVGMVNSLDYAKRSGASTFVYASSGGIYGYGREEFQEDKTIDATGQLGYYLSTKLCSEILLESYAPFLNIVILRFFFVYGPHQRSDMLIPRLVRSVIDGRPISLHGRDGIRINPTYVTDAAKATVMATTLGMSQKLNIGGPEILTLRQVGEQIGVAVGRTPVFSVQDGIEPSDLVGNIARMSHVLFPPSVAFCDGIEAYLRTDWPDLTAGNR
jgi:UDP-glucose 4-epimerase